MHDLFVSVSMMAEMSQGFVSIPQRTLFCFRFHLSLENFNLETGRRILAAAEEDSKVVVNKKG